jgi:hypothetical protein
METIDATTATRESERKKAGQSGLHHHWTASPMSAKKSAIAHDYCSIGD